jgi:hypothetical protein
MHVLTRAVSDQLNCDSPLYVITLLELPHGDRVHRDIASGHLSW